MFLPDDSHAVRSGRCLYEVASIEAASRLKANFHFHFGEKLSIDHLKRPRTKQRDLKCIRFSQIRGCSNICQYVTIHRRIHHNTSKIIHVLQDVAWPTWPVHSGKSLVGLGQSSADWPVCYVSLQCQCRITVVHLNTSVNTSQYIVEYIIIPLK